MINNNDIEEKEGFIFDVDGTLYSQPRMHIMMFIKLFRYYAIRPWRYKELYAIFLFRKYRERKEYHFFTMEKLYETVAVQTRMRPEEVEAVIWRWMFEIPLEVILACAFPKILSFIRRMDSIGKKIIIYSDYPALKKLNALQVPFHALFVSGQEGLPALKPCADAMRYIIKQIGIPRENLLYIGDRDEKDRLSAELGGIHYFDISEFLKVI